MKKLVILFFIIMMLTACKETIRDDYKFTGESEHWRSEYAYKRTEVWGEDNGKSTYSSEDSYELILIYKGSLEELSSMDKLEYSYKTNSSGGSKLEEFTEPLSEVIFRTSGASRGGAKVSEDEVIQVNVKWNGVEETIELINKSE